MSLKLCWFANRLIQPGKDENIEYHLQLNLNVTSITLCHSVHLHLLLGDDVPDTREPVREQTEGAHEKCEDEAAVL